MARCVLDHILVLPDKPKTPEAGILIPDDVQKQREEESMEGTIVEIGPGRYLESGELCKMTPKKGDRILFSLHSGITVYILDGKGKDGKGRLHRVMREPDVLVILDTPKKIIAG